MCAHERAGGRGSRGGYRRPPPRSQRTARSPVEVFGQPPRGEWQGFETYLGVESGDFGHAVRLERQDTLKNMVRHSHSQIVADRILLASDLSSIPDDAKVLCSGYRYSSLRRSRFRTNQFSVLSIKVVNCTTPLRTVRMLPKKPEIVSPISAWLSP